MHRRFKIIYYYDEAEDIVPHCGHLGHSDESSDLGQENQVRIK